MDCRSYKKILTEAALDEVEGNQLPFELRAHINACADCRAQLEREQLVIAVMDRGVRATVSGDPSADFAARVLRRIQEERAPRRWSAGWAPAAVGALAVMAIVVVWFARREPTRPSMPPSAEHRASQALANKADALPTHKAAVQAPTMPGTQIQGHAGRRGAAHRERVAVKASQPEVRVPPEEQAAVLRLYAALRSGRVDGGSLVAEPLPLAPVEINIAPLEVAPLDAAPKPTEHDANL